jgi:predicted site-specific integrase-resolvase
MKSTTQLAKKYKVTSQTIRNWIKSGKLEVSSTTKGGHFRIKEKIEKGFIYVRVSSHKQKTSLKTQEEILKRSYPDYEVISDIASAFNFQRKGLKTLLELTMQGTAIEVVATTQDRIARSGFTLIKWLIELQGGRVITMEEEVNTEDFNTKELIGFITSFCNSYYGKRGAKRIKENKNLSKK